MCKRLYFNLRGSNIKFFQVLSSNTASNKMIGICSAIVITLGPSLLALLTALAHTSQREDVKSKDLTSGERNGNRWKDFIVEFPVWTDSFTCLLHVYLVSQQSRYLDISRDIQLIRFTPTSISLKSQITYTS